MIIAYTAIYGGYDDLKPHPEHPYVDRWLCYTDNQDIDAQNWDVIIDPGRFQHPRLSAKWHKCHPPVADSTVWLDGSIEMHNTGLIDAILENLQVCDWTMFSHPVRTTILDEAQASVPLHKYHGLPIMEQVQHYLDQGYPDTTLWATTTIGRDHSQRVLQASAAWFCENERWTYQDQLSLPPVLHRFGIDPKPLPYSLWGNPWFDLRHHASHY